MQINVGLPRVIYTENEIVPGVQSQTQWVQPSNMYMQLPGNTNASWVEARYGHPLPRI